MHTVAELYPSERVANCGRFVSSRDGTLEVRVKTAPDGSKSARYVGLNRCGQHNLCPNCAQVRASLAAEELREGYKAALAKGMPVALVTLTYSHHAGNTYEDARERFNAALTRMRSGRAWHLFIRRWGVAGWYYGGEETYGANGWHLHEHSLLALRPRHMTSSDWRELRRELSELYLAALATQGLSASDERGVDVDGSRGRVAEYVAKGGGEVRWDQAAEVAGGTTKKGRKGRTQWQLLRDGALGDAAALSRFREYADYWRTHKRRHAGWSPGLYKRLFGYSKASMPAHVKDAIALTRELQAGRVVLHLSADEYYALCRMGADGTLLWLTTLWDAPRLRRFVLAVSGAWSARSEAAA